jgi:hypothetical protein
MQSQVSRGVPGNLQNSAKPGNPKPVSGPARSPRFTLARAVRASYSSFSEYQSGVSGCSTGKRSDTALSRLAASVLSVLKDVDEVDVGVAAPSFDVSDVFVAIEPERARRTLLP